MTVVAGPRRPQLREHDVELATALGRSPELRVWRSRLTTLRVVRANRYVRGHIVGRHAWWDVRLEADDGWHAEGEIVDVEPLIEVDRILDELGLGPDERLLISANRARRLVRWLLWDELWLARDRLQTRLLDVEWIEVGDGSSET